MTVQQGPTLTITDKADGTGVTATISDGDNVEYTVYYAKHSESDDWTEGGSRFGNGTIDVAITSRREYWFYVRGEY